MSAVRARRRSLEGRAAVFAALGDETRLSLLGKLCGGQRQSISQLAGGSSLTRQAITKHLRVLEDAGVVKSERRGRETVYELTPDPLEEAKQALEQVSH